MAALQRFEDGLLAVRDLKGLPPHKLAERESEAFDSVRRGLIAVKGSAEALDGCAEEDKSSVLALVVKRGTEKKMLKARAQACLAIVLTRPKWTAALIAQPAVLENAKALLSDAPEISALLEPKAMEEAVEAEAAAEAKKAAEAAAEGPTDAEADPDEASDHDPHPKLRAGRDVMRGFEWEFPHTVGGLQVDRASAGFKEFFDGVTLVTTRAGLEAIGGDVAGLLSEFDEEWPDILRFLVSMYESRLSQRSRIKFVIKNLLDNSPAFKDALAARDTMPIEDFAGYLAPPSATRSVSTRSLPPPDPVGKPSVIWVDYKSKAFETSDLIVDDRVHFLGFHDDPKADDYQGPDVWFNYVIDHAETAERVAVVILNKRHLRMVRQMKDYCTQQKVEPPKFIVCTRATDLEDGLEDVFVTQDWNRATEVATEEIERLAESKS
eukprot:TRINITY_DN26305_c0_g1_i1.p1 TRINITY_DN26305_c0_g1~~TRINITY_DN26305_c0_g1_i1.p1  ORF type:complete len:437 (+),score=124.35 TRINITY_DN26305_c0_g1_i1:132-1442(+)